MSSASAQEFVKKVAEDEALRNEVNACIESANGDRQAAVDLATSKGYDFTYEELKAVVEGELSDEALEAVAGGAGLPTWGGGLPTWPG
jgi:predicted ribosomally synthesized peptide with nif11-like leader